MTEKQYRLNKWGTRLLKNNRPLFDWTNEPDKIVDLLNQLNNENKALKEFIQDLATKGTGRIDLADGYSYNTKAILKDYDGDME